LKGGANDNPHFTRPYLSRASLSSETIELCVRWYISYRLSYRDLAAMMAEREIAVSHTTVIML
jgi:transposase-like protein